MGAVRDDDRNGKSDATKTTVDRERSAFLLQKQSHSKGENPLEEGFSKLIMAFFGSAVDVLQKLVIGLGAGLGVWGGVNLMEGYGNDNPGAKSQGVKQLVAGGGVALIGLTLVPLLANIFA